MKSRTLDYYYDKEKYSEMVLDAAETVLEFFGFDRIVYGNLEKIRKWYEEFREKEQNTIHIGLDD
jgi:hypothetical protein